jgi:hypothetical protein
MIPVKVPFCVFFRAESSRHTYSWKSDKIHTYRTMHLCILILLMLVHLDVIQCSVGKKELCLLDGQVYHVNSEKCLNLLKRGPCDKGQHLTVGKDGTGIIRIKYA